MANRHWIEIYSFSVITHLPIFPSDHPPNVLDTRSRKFYEIITFRFEAKWFLKDNFMDIVKPIWPRFIKGSSAFPFVKKTNLFKKEIVKSYLQDDHNYLTSWKSF